MCILPYYLLLAFCKEKWDYVYFFLCPWYLEHSQIWQFISSVKWMTRHLLASSHSYYSPYILTCFLVDEHTYQLVNSKKMAVLGFRAFQRILKEHQKNVYKWLGVSIRRELRGPLIPVKSTKSFFYLQVYYNKESKGLRMQLMEASKRVLGFLKLESQAIVHCATEYWKMNSGSLKEQHPLLTLRYLYSLAALGFNKINIPISQQFDFPWQTEVLKRFQRVPSCDQKPAIPTTTSLPIS